MMIQVEDLAADAVIGVRFDSNEFEVNSKAMSEVVAYGTVVNIAKNNEDLNNEDSSNQ